MVGCFPSQQHAGVSRRTTTTMMVMILITVMMLKIMSLKNKCITKEMKENFMLMTVPV